MARIWFTSSGKVGQYDPHMEAEPFVAGPEGCTPVAFDESTNPALAEQIGSKPEEFRLVGDSLVFQGAPVTIAPDGPVRIGFRRLMTEIVPKLEEGGDPLTDSDIKCVFRLLLAKLAAGRL